MSEPIADFRDLPPSVQVRFATYIIERAAQQTKTDLDPLYLLEMARAFAKLADDLEAIAGRLAH